MANMKALVEITDWEEGQAFRTAYPEIRMGGRRGTYLSQIMETASKADDWQYYLYDEMPSLPIKFALSPSLGVSRQLTPEEFRSLHSLFKDTYEKLYGEIPPPLSPEQLAKRHENLERRFNIQLSYSTIGTSPEDALATFFAAVTRPGAMVAEIYEEGAERVVEIDGDEIVRIAAGQFGQNGPDSEPEDDYPTL